MENYRDIFEKIESTLIRVGSQNLPEKTIREELDRYKNFKFKEYSDDEYYSTMVPIIFYSGFKANTVTSKLETINRHFSGYQKAAAYTEKQIEIIASDPEMIKNRNKINACISNAKKFKEIIAEKGSIQNYIESFKPEASDENIKLLWSGLKGKFKGLGPITTFHFMADIGLNVLKPDRVICRSFDRLGFVKGPIDNNPEKLWEVVLCGRQFAKATWLPIRYIDIVFVDYGQMSASEVGIKKGICLEKDRQCSICGIKKYCKYRPFSSIDLC